MEKMYECCCGVDVHKKMIVVCFRTGNKQEMRQYGTTTDELLQMGEWLKKLNCQMVAMESTGSYWKPVYNVLEVMEIPVMVVNAQHMKAVPGRKTDIKDAQWIADLLHHGLLKASFIPSKEQRELRDIVRYRKSLTEERAREINRLEKILEGGNIKLSSIISDLTGKSSIKLIKGIVSGNEISKENIKEYFCGSLKASKEEILAAIKGVLSKKQKLLVTAIINHIEDMSRRIKELDEIIAADMEEEAEAIKLLDEIPGVGEHSAQVILAEIGVDMSRFPSAAHLASWSGLSPGNNESAGKRKSGKTTKGNKTLKTTLIQCATTAIRKKCSYFKAQYEKLVVRRGSKRAIVAVAHSMIIAIYYMLKKQEQFKDLGIDYYKQFDREKKIWSCLKKLNELGWQPPVPVAG